MVKTLTQEQIDNARDISVKQQPLRKEVHLSRIKVVDDSHFEIEGQKIRCTEGAMKGFLKHIGLSNTFINRFKTLFSESTSKQLINKIREAQASQGGKVWLGLNPVTKTIASVSPHFGDRMSAGRFVGFADSLLGDSGMQITNWSVSPNGDIQINAYNPYAQTEIQLNGADGGSEVFTGGLNLSMNLQDGVMVRPYVNRMWCANGMVNTLAEDAYKLNTLDSTTLDKFYNQMEELRKSNWLPPTFSDRVQNSSGVAASMAEMQSAYNRLQPIFGENTERWIPFNENLRAYRKMGVQDMDLKQMQKAKTNTSIWDLTNGITHAATHGGDYVENWQDTNATNLMVFGGNIFSKKEWDHQHDVLNPFSELKASGSLLN